MTSEQLYFSLILWRGSLSIKPIPKDNNNCKRFHLTTRFNAWIQGLILNAAYEPWKVPLFYCQRKPLGRQRCAKGCQAPETQINQEGSFVASQSLEQECQMVVRKRSHWSCEMEGSRELFIPLPRAPIKSSLTSHIFPLPHGTKDRERGMFCKFIYILLKCWFKQTKTSR